MSKGKILLLLVILSTILIYMLSLIFINTGNLLINIAIAFLIVSIYIVLLNFIFEKIIR